MPVSSFRFQTPEELLRELGSRLRELRIRRGLEQAELAERAGVAVRTLGALERGQGSTTETLLRVLKGLDSLQWLEAVAPQPTVSPMALLRQATPRQRVRKPKGSGR